MAKSKILNVNPPLINCYTKYGTLFSIIPESDQLSNWVNSNFIQLVYNISWDIYTFNNHSFLLSECPAIGYFQLSKNLFTRLYRGSLIDLVKSILDSNEYVYIFVDRHYISTDCDNYQKHHLIHELLIYGYDEKQDIFYIADNFDDGKFMFIVCPSKDIEKGFLLLEGKEEYYSYIRTLKVYPNFQYSLDLEQIKYELYSFLNSTKTYYVKNETDRVFGLEIFTILQKQIQECFQNSNLIDIRAFHLLYEHMLLMEERINHLAREKHIVDPVDLSDSVKSVKRLTLLLRNLVVKYNIKMDDRAFVRVSDTLAQLKSDEEKIFSRLLSSIV